MNNHFKIVCPQCQQDNLFSSPSNQPIACSNCGAPLPADATVITLRAPIGIRLTEQSSQRTFELKFFHTAFFGRQEIGSTFFLNNSISRRHCMIKLTKNQYWVVDVGSTYGTFVLVKGERIECKEPVRLEDDGILILGEAGYQVNIMY
ncbi:MAG: FHA domain-containing protein [Chitinophaga sp.]|uniref:FHA domain-containing protein n=1 Tax=Chitinophaga sp. TaxID=1869181 RepID=UPI0025C38F83|nr:FHA domain-containing protein [Chitinophaga sp.]MBV8255076.1 FHA domain-containing protein [Chitinophaga sp.]